MPTRDLARARTLIASQSPMLPIPRPVDLAVWIGLGLFCASSLLVGLRLLLLWRKTGQAPELLVALALLGIGPLGFGLTVASSSMAAHWPDTADAVWASAAMALNLGAASVYLFSQRVFLPSSRLAAAVVWLIVALLVACWLAELLVNGFHAEHSAGAPIRVSDWLRTGALLWGAWQAAVFYRVLLRRRSYGLVDDQVMRRMLHWAIALGGAGLSSGIDAATKLGVEAALDYPALTLLNASAGTSAAIFLYLAFRPGADLNQKASPELTSHESKLHS